MRLYLASTSPARLALLRSAGVEPVVIPSRVDEDAVLAQEASARGVEVGALAPADVVQVLARAKALAVANDPAVRDPDTGGPLDGLVLGGDSVFHIGGEVLGKPHDPAVARRRWIAQRGRTGTLWSGHWLVDRRSGAEGPGTGRAASASVSFVDDLSDAEIDAYIASGEPLEVAGAFTIDSLGGPFIERVDGDPSTVVGLSLPTVRRLVRELGVEWFRLWRTGAAHTG